MKALFGAVTLFGFGLVSSVHAAPLWTAGEDLYLNEINTPHETSDPNYTVPEWSYGYRTTLASTALTLYSVGDHTNAVAGVSGLEGWFNGANDCASVNVTGSPISAFTWLPIASHEMLVHPGNSSQLAVVRWTAPASGNYSIDALWQVLSSGGDGVSLNIVLNGSSIFGQSLLFGASPATPSFSSLSLSSGDLVDFVIGGNLGVTSDATRFNATIQAVPEPSTTALLLGAGTLAIAFKRRRFRKV